MFLFSVIMNYLPFPVSDAIEDLCERLANVLRYSSYKQKVTLPQISLESVIIMQDIRLERWAHTLVHYSLYLKPGETLAIRTTPLAAPLVEEVYREALRIGAYPLVLLDLESLDEILLKEGNERQLVWTPPTLTALANHIDAQLSIGARSNTKALSGVDGARMGKRRVAMSEVG